MQSFEIETIGSMSGLMMSTATASLALYVRRSRGISSCEPVSLNEEILVSFCGAISGCLIAGMYTYFIGEVFKLNRVLPDMMSFLVRLACIFGLFSGSLAGKKLREIVICII